jgi:long-chain acyl-CoA synthetase
VAAYIELQPGAEPDVNALIAHCRELIASYKKPKHVIFVQSLPRTSTGKVLKGELRERFAADSELVH